MEEKDFDAKLAKLAHDIEQLDGKIDDKISSLREELRKWILGAYLAHTREISTIYIDLVIALKPSLSEAAQRARDEIAKLSKEQVKTLDKIPADEFEKDLIKFRENINRITRSAGLGEIWEIETKA